jgi:hypothetical protein
VEQPKLPFAIFTQATLFDYHKKYVKVQSNEPCSESPCVKGIKASKNIEIIIIMTIRSIQLGVDHPWRSIIHEPIALALKPID